MKKALTAHPKQTYCKKQHSQDKGQKRNGRSIDQLVEISCQKKPRNFTSTEETK